VNSALGDYLMESVVALALVVALAVFVLYSARRAGLGRGSLGPIELVARLPLEARRSVYVVRVLDQVLIIGSSEAGLARLGQLPDGAAAEFRDGVSARGFAGVLAGHAGVPEQASGASVPAAKGGGTAAASTRERA
jgi:flagellar biosynthesis protein FliO